MITVVNEHQIQEFSDNRQQIESFLSQRLGRDVKLVVNKREIEISKSLSPKEALDKMKSKNKHLQDFTDRIGLDFVDTICTLFGSIPKKVCYLSTLMVSIVINS